jgi:hypothetical protein
MEEPKFTMRKRATVDPKRENDLKDRVLPCVEKSRTDNAAPSFAHCMTDNAEPSLTNLRKAKDAPR